MGNPEDVRTLERIGWAGSGSLLAALIEAKVPHGSTPRVGGS
jgi:hypothetical protein